MPDPARARPDPADAHLKQALGGENDAYLKVKDSLRLKLEPGEDPATRRLLTSGRSVV